VRVGCISAGCCWGREVEGWPAMFLPDIHGYWTWRYPTQLISLGVNLLLFGALLALERWGGRAKWRFAGSLFLVYLFFYGLQDFLFGFWRADLPSIAGVVTWNQVYDLIGVAIVAAVFIWRARLARQGGAASSGVGSTS